MIGSLVVLVYMFLVQFFKELRYHQKDLLKQWDVKTVTAADYTIEFDISVEAFKYWKDHYYDKLSPMNECKQF
jgi:hypothetical protein